MTAASDVRLTPEQLSQRWEGQPSPRTLAQWRYLGKGPSYIKVGRLVLYPLEAVLDFERMNTVRAGAA